MPIVSCPNYELPILKAIAEMDRRRAVLHARPDGYQYSYSATDFRDRVFELMADQLTSDDFEDAGQEKERTTYAWLRLRSQLGQMVKSRKDKGQLLVRVREPGRKTRYRMKDSGIKRLNYLLGTDFQLAPPVDVLN